MDPSNHKLLAANRGEIAIRIFRAANELGLRTVSIYAEEDRFSRHRFKADEAYQLDTSKGPVGAYLDYEGIVALAKSKGVTMIHPGYGFLSENPDFARACARARTRARTRHSTQKTRLNRWDASTIVNPNVYVSLV